MSLQFTLTRSDSLKVLLSVFTLQLIFFQPYATLNRIRKFTLDLNKDAADLKGENHEKSKMNTTSLLTMKVHRSWDDNFKNHSTSISQNQTQLFRNELRPPMAKDPIESSMEIVDYDVNTTSITSKMKSNHGSDVQNFSLRDIGTYLPSNETEHVEDYNHICFYGSTRVFFREQATKSFVTNLLTILRDISLRSFNEAFVSNQTVEVLLPITGYQTHFRSLQEVNDFLNSGISRYTKIQVVVSPNAYTITRSKFPQTKCQWVVSTLLDADDVIFPGYLDWIAQSVIPTLHHGALVGGQQLDRLQIGFGRCKLQKLQRPIHFPGESMAQTRIFRRDIFELLGMPFEPPAHSTALIVLRRQVFRKLYKKKKLPAALSNNQIRGPNSFNLQLSWDVEMENITGIRMVEPSLGSNAFGVPSVYLRSPLSSHFEYSEISNAPYCTKAEWADVWDEVMRRNKVKSQMDYIVTTLNNINFTVYDTCQSHSMFQQFLSSKNRDWFGNASMCSTLEDVRMKKLW